MNANPYNTFLYAVGAVDEEVIGLGICRTGHEKEVSAAAVRGERHPEWIADIPDGNSEEGRRKAALILELLNKP